MAEFLKLGWTWLRARSRLRYRSPHRVLSTIIDDDLADHRVEWGSYRSLPAVIVKRRRLQLVRVNTAEFSPLQTSAGPWNRYLRAVVIIGNYVCTQCRLWCGLRTEIGHRAMSEKCQHCLGGMYLCLLARHTLSLFSRSPIQPLL